MLGRHGTQSPKQVAEGVSEMTIEAILNGKGRTVVSVPPSASVSEVVATLRRHGIGAVLVLDPAASQFDIRDRHILGIVSERDIIRALVEAHGAGDVLDMAASQVMTEVRSTISLSADLATAALMMTERRVRHLPVLEHEVLVGMVSIGDVVKARLVQQASEVESLKAYVGGAQ